MKLALKRAYHDPKYSKVIHWGKLISITGSAQLIVQAAGLVTGIMIIRLMPVNEYAWYVIANTMLGTMTVLADSGISAGVTAEGGKVWQDKEQLGKVIATGLDLRRKFAILSLIIAVPILLYLLVHNGASWLTASLIAASLIPSFLAALSDSLLEIVPKLHQDIKPLQKNQVSVSLGRLLLSALFLFIFPLSFVAILATGVPRTYGNISLRKISNKFVAPNQKPDKEIRNRIFKVVFRILPNVIYYCISGQVTVFLLSILGNTSSIGQIGALGRITMFLSLLSTVFTTVITPYFARLKNEFKVLMTKYIQILFLTTLVFVLLTIFVYFFPGIFLFILGKKYHNLGNELVLCVIASCLNLLSGCSFSLTTSRGWVLNPIFGIPMGILSIAIGVSVFDFTKLRGALDYNIFLQATSLAIVTIFCFVKIIQQKKNITN